MADSRIWRWVIGIGMLALVLWESSYAARFARWLFGTVAGLDFVYERMRDPSWIGVIVRILASPPPGITLTGIVAALTLIYWTSKSKDQRMTAPAIGMVLSGIVFAGCLFWLLYERYLGEPVPPSEPTTSQDAPKLPLKRMLTAYDVEQRLRAVDNLLEFLDGKWMKVSRDAEVLTQEIYNRIEAGTAVADLDKFAENAQATIKIISHSPFVMTDFRTSTNKRCAMNGLCLTYLRPLRYYVLKSKRCSNVGKSRPE